MTGTARVDAVVVAYASAASIVGVVEQLLGHAEIATVTVVDHGTDGSGALAQAAGATVELDPTNPGFGTGVNRGARRGRAPYLLLLNPDASLERGAVAAGVAALDADAGVAAVEGLIRTSSTGGLERAGGRELGPVDLLGRATGAKRLLALPGVASLVRRLPGLAHQVDRGVTEATDVEALTAAAMLVRRSAFTEVGGFDDRYFLYGEDIDLCRRLRARGWRLRYLPVPWADHADGSSSDGWVRRELVWWEGAMRFAARWWSTSAFLLAQLAASGMVFRLAVHDPSSAREAWRRVVLGAARIRRTE